MMKIQWRDGVGRLTRVFPVFLIAAFASCAGSPASGGTGLSPQLAGCNPGETQACYSGPAGTEGVGACKAGLQVCLANRSFGSCGGEVLPVQEDCRTRDVDEDCDDDPFDNICAASVVFGEDPDINPQLEGSGLDGDGGAGFPGGDPVQTWTITTSWSKASSTGDQNYNPGVWSERHTRTATQGGGASTSFSSVRVRRESGSNGIEERIETQNGGGNSIVKVDFDGVRTERAWNGNLAATGIGFGTTNQFGSCPTIARGTPPVIRPDGTEYSWVEPRPNEDVTYTYQCSGQCGSRPSTLNDFTCQCIPAEGAQPNPEFGGIYQWQIECVPND